MGTELFILGAIGTVAASMTAWRCARFNAWKRARAARGVSIQNFLKRLGSDFPSEVAETTYRFFQGQTPNSMPVQESDSLGEIYGIVGGDIFDEMCFLADDCGLPRPSEEQAYRVETVRDAVELMASLKPSDAGPTKGAESLPVTKD